MPLPRDGSPSTRCRRSRSTTTRCFDVRAVACASVLNGRLSRLTCCRANSRCRSCATCTGRSSTARSSRSGFAGGCSPLVSSRERVVTTGRPRSIGCRDGWRSGPVRPCGLRRDGPALRTGTICPGAKPWLGVWAIPPWLRSEVGAPPALGSPPQLAKEIPGDQARYCPLGRAHSRSPARRCPRAGLTRHGNGARFGLQTGAHPHAGSAPAPPIRRIRGACSGAA